MRIFAFILFFTVSLFAQQTEPEFTRISLEDGLSQSVVLDILQDSTGFLWIATQDGLNRYDGYEFLILKNNPDDSASITDNWITSLCLQNKKTLFAGTVRGGLNKINLENLSSEKVLLDSQRTGSQQYVTKLLLLDNYLFVGTWGNGLYRINLNNNAIKNFTAKNSELPNDRIRALGKLNSDEILIGTVNGLSKFNAKTNSFRNLFTESQLSENFILSVFVDSRNVWWIGTRNGLNIYNPKKNKLIKYYADRIGDKIILDVLEDKNGYVWVSTYNAGVSKTALSLRDKKFDYEKIEFLNFKYSHSKPNSISANYVRKIFQDKSEVLWFGTWGGGLSKLDAKPPKFVKVTPYNLLRGKLSSPLIRTFVVFDNRLWIGTAEKGIDIFDFNSNDFSHLSMPEFRMNGEIISFLPRKKKLFIGTRSGLNIYENGKPALLKIARDIPSLPKIISVYSMLNFKNNILLGTTVGLIAYNINSKKFYLPEQKTKIKIPEFSVNYLFADSSRNVWIATKENFLFKMNFSERNGKLEIVSFKKISNPQLKKHPGQKRVNYIHGKKDGTLWLATSQGLIKLGKDNSIEKIYSRKDGLANEIIYAILEDKNENLWVSTNKGISKLSFGDSVSIKNYTIADGLQSNEFIQASCYRSGDTLYFGGINGYNYFIPEKIKANPYPPEVVLTEFRIANKKAQLPASFGKAHNLEVRYSDKIFTFVFAALDFTHPSRNQYSYYLKGFDKTRIITNERKITYTNLDPGEYVLIVNAANNDGVWSKTPYKIKLSVIPPFWMTWQFKLFLLALFAALVAYIVRLRFKRLLETERLRTKIASDLHDDVGSMLSQISIYAELIGYETSLEKAKAHGKFIAEKSRQIIGVMSDIIWSIDSRYDKVENLIDRMREFGSNITQGKNIKFVFDVSVAHPDKILSAEQRQNIFMIFKEAVNNAVKYSGTDEIIAELKISGNKLVLSIRDFGTGVEIEKLKRVSGIRNMQMRAQRINGRINFKNDRGFAIYLEVKF